MSRNRLLIVEDEPSQRMIIQSILETDYALEIVGSFEVAKERILTQNFDLFLLDIMLEDGSGLDLARFLRGLKQHRTTPIIFLSAKEDVNSKIEGFDVGADDYIVKPVDPKELKVRINSKLRRYQDYKEPNEYVQFGELIFDIQNQRVSCQDHQAEGGVREFNLTPIEFKLLLLLARQEGNALKREEILAQVWGKQTHVMDRSVDTYVASLRRKLGNKSFYIKSVHGIGYRFQAASTDVKTAA